jgi:predicted aspartyl protease
VALHRTGTLVLAAVAATCTVARAPEQPPDDLARTISALLAAGNVEQADMTRERARQLYPDDGLVLWWSATVSNLLWQDERAATELDSLRRTRDRGGLDPVQCNGLLGDVLFRSGRWGESIGPLQAAYAGPDGLRRTAFAIAAGELPFRRKQTGPLATEQPLLEGTCPEFLCGSSALRRPFAIDTGTSMTTLSRSLASELGVHVVTGAGQARDGTGHELPVEVGVLPSCFVGDVDLGAVPVLIVDDERLQLRDMFGGAERSPQAVLGLDLLALFRLTLDPQRHSVVLELPRGLAEDDSVQCVRAEGRCLVPVAVEGTRLWFVLDTGASHSSLSEAGLLALPDGAARAVAGYRRIRTASGPGTAVREVRDLVLRLSQVRFRGVTLPVIQRESAGAFPVHGVIGADLLLQCLVTLDRGRARLVHIE